jgi:hypothetical protein
MKIGLISNRNARQNRKRLDRIVAPLAGLDNVDAVIIEGVLGMPEALRRFADTGVEIVAVNGGDGTVQAALSMLWRENRFAMPPRIAVIPGGNTNMIAHDVNEHRRPEAAAAQLAEIARGVRPAATAPRRLLKVENTGTGEVLRGGFFGTGAIYRAVQATRRSVHPMHIESDAAAGVTLAGILLRRVFTFGRADSIVRGDPMTSRFDDGHTDDGTNLLLLATTLDTLLLSSRPYWGTQPGALHWTAVRYPAPRLLRAVRRVLWRGGDGLDPAIYLSRNAVRIELKMDCPFTLDGEFYAPRDGKPVILSAEEPVDYVRC